MSLNELLHHAKPAWHGVHLGNPDWGPHTHSVAFSVEMQKEKIALHIILNAYWEPLDFELPDAGEGSQQPCRRWIDTALDSPDDIVDWRSAPPVSGFAYRAQPRSVVVLYAATE